jgi:hypothetical protein
MSKPKNLVEAVLKVMEECSTIDKSMTVGSGRNSYKGVSDADVKLKFNKSMRENGLIMLPVDIEPKTTVNSWETVDYNGNPTTKFSYFTEVITKYELCHTSGESKILAGYGHGVDPSDKGAGKATTYSMKYTMLYAFLVATGAIDDADNTHSDDAPKVVKKKAPAKKAPATKKVEANPNANTVLSDERFAAALTALRGHKTTYEKIKGYKLSPNQLSELNKTAKEIEELSK